MAAANGVVTDEAKQAFQRAVAGDPHDAKAGYYLGLADEQDGNPAAAAAKWRALLARRRPMRRGRISCARRWRASPAAPAAANGPNGG